MNEKGSESPVPGVVRTIVCIAWAAAVVLAYCVVYSGALVQQATSAAGRFPFLGRILELFHLGS